jgi:hypothetical protein
MMRLAIGSESAMTSEASTVDARRQRKRLFAYDEGLPSKAWASGHPVILTEFADSCFKRIDVAIEADGSAPSPATWRSMRS